MVMRVSGLASGMETDDLIKQLMSAQRAPMNKLAQKKQLLEWKRDDYRALNNKILEFRNSTTDMRLESSYLSKKVSSSQDASVSASAGASANEGIYSIEVVKLASTASMTSEALNAVRQDITTLKELDNNFKSGKIVITGAKGEKEITVGETTTLASLVADINTVSNATGMKASYDPGTKKMYFTSTQSGKLADDGIKLELKDVVLKDENGTAPSLQSLLKVGSGNVASANGVNAQVRLNGSASIDEFSSNNFTVAGISYNIKQETTAPINITVTKDTDAAFDKIVKFVDKYNSLISEVNKKLNEKKYRDFQPLTADERKDLKEDEIKQWEEKAKSGTLRGENLLLKGLSDLRFAMSSTVSGLPEGQLRNLSDIGISNANVNGKTISGSFADGGMLYIDETKLKKALSEKPEEVLNLFKTDGETSSQDGIATRLYDKASALFAQVTEKAGTANAIEDRYEIGKTTKDINEQITRMTRRLEDLEARYYKQFTAMETVLNKMNSQSAWLSQQFA
ncbi:flagellar filament capping protein FliD [Paenibacillus luteus]|uniref:flagellar filament capping protein FliD n=1 Tax=Paenibacillus luteus TaxID=2545753 RepID=UPI001144ECE2|nr:flagellar filament capping protein FliD [Paenibacillus luteus]